MIDRLKWFKFDPASWMMGRIQRESNDVQASFIRLCCQYWFHQCNYSIDNAILECGQEIFDKLLDRKIITVEDENIHIKFLDEQKSAIEEVSEAKSKAAKARWSKENNTDAMHVHKGAMQKSKSEYNYREDKEEDKEEDKDNIKYIVAYLNEKTGKNFKHTTGKTKKTITARMNEGFTVDEFKRVIDFKSKQWKSDPKMSEYLRPETLFGTKFEGYLNATLSSPKSIDRPLTPQESGFVQ